MTARIGAQSNNASDVYLGPQLLFQILGANFQLTTDQALTKLFSGSAYQVTAVVARPRTGAASVACAGGLYDAAAKGGNQLVATGQSWVALSSTASPPVTVNGAVNLPAAVLTNTPILSLTTGSTAAITADLYVYGYDVT